VAVAAIYLAVELSGAQLSTGMYGGARSLSTDLAHLLSPAVPCRSVVVTDVNVHIAAYVSVQVQVAAPACPIKNRGGKSSTCSAWSVVPPVGLFSCVIIM
jgi:hypothetical protein